MARKDQGGGDQAGTSPWPRWDGDSPVTDAQSLAMWQHVRASRRDLAGFPTAQPYPKPSC